MWSTYSTAEKFTTVSKIYYQGTFESGSTAAGGQSFTFNTDTPSIGESNSGSSSGRTTIHSGAYVYSSGYTSESTFVSDGVGDGTYNSESTVLDWILLGSGASQGTSTGSFDAFAYNYTTTETQETNTDGQNARTTITTQLDYYLFFPDGEETSTTYSQLTTIYTSERTYTEVTTASSFGTAALGKAINNYDGKAIYVVGEIGRGWTEGQGLIRFCRFLSSDGSFSIYDTNIALESYTANSFEVESSSLEPNVLLSYDQTSTIATEQTTILTYDITTGTTYERSYDSYYAYQYEEPRKFKLFDSTTFAGVSYFTSSETSESTVHYQVELTGYPENKTGLSLAYLTTTRLTQIATTISSVFFQMRNNTSFTSSSYRKSTSTTFVESYVLASMGVSGSFSSETTASGSAGAGGVDPFGVTQTSSSSNSFRYFTSEVHKPSLGLFDKSFYKLNFYSTGNATSYTQLSPSYKFVVASSSGYPVYKENIEPSTLITSLFFTTWAFHRFGSWSPPTLAVPIDFTYAGEEVGLPTTLQIAIVPTGFYYGDESASVYRTTSSSEGDSGTTQSYTLVYAGSGSELTIYALSNNDFSSTVPDTSNIYHSVGLAGSSSRGASWSLDGLHYWDSTSRRTEGSLSVPVCPVDGGTATLICTQWVSHPAGNGLFTELVSYKNS